MQTPPLAAPDRLEFRLLLTAHAKTVRVPRKLTEIALDNWDLAHLKDRAAVIVSELATNCALYLQGTEIEVAVFLRDGWVRLEVWDESPKIPKIPVSLNSTDLGGRGLYVANALAEKFGIEPRTTTAGGGKTIWAMLLCDSTEITDEAA